MDITITAGGGDKRKSWERQKNESAKAYAAFTIYRGLPAQERLYGVVASKLGKSNSLIDSWGRKWKWIERSAEYDTYMESLRMVMQEQSRLEMNDLHAKVFRNALVKAAKRLQEIEPDELTINQTLLWLVEAAKAERLARGEAPVESGRGTVVNFVIETYDDKEEQGGGTEEHSG